MKTTLILAIAQQLSATIAVVLPARSTMSTQSRNVSFDQLPLNEGDPPYSAWGLWGKDDELGRINLITPETTKRASSEIRTGEAISLNMPLNVPLKPMNPVRKALNHTIIPKASSNDDEMTMNTQASSHWDSPRHYPYQDTLRFYNHATQEDISGPNKTDRIGIQNIANHPIATRGILLDYVEYAKARNISYDAFTSHTISHEVLQEIADSHNIQFRTADVLLVRSGWALQYAVLNDTEKLSISAREGDNRAHVGVKATVGAARWHWENGFAAVGGDTVAYETMPLGKGGDGTILHEIFLSGWAMPIGETFDLEKLAQRCKEQDRYTFFLTSQPLNLPGGIASPPNVMAIF